MCEGDALSPCGSWAYCIRKRCYRSENRAMPL